MTTSKTNLSFNMFLFLTKYSSTKHVFLQNISDQSYQPVQEVHSLGVMKDLVMITGRFSKLEVAEEMGKPEVKTGLLDLGVKEGRWESSSGEEEDVINNKVDSGGKRKEDSADNMRGQHLITIRMMKILPRPLTFWYLKNENTREWNSKQNQVPLLSRSRPRRTSGTSTTTWSRQASWMMDVTSPSSIRASSLTGRTGRTWREEGAQL